VSALGDRRSALGDRCPALGARRLATLALLAAGFGGGGTALFGGFGFDDGDEERFFVGIRKGLSALGFQQLSVPS
jgi:hypothetical protein